MAAKNPVVSTTLPIKRLIIQHLKDNTSLVYVTGDAKDESAKNPMALVQIGPARTTEDINGVKDEMHEFGVRIKARDEDSMWQAVEEVRTLWYGTGANSLFNELHDLGVLNISHASTNPGFSFDKEEQVCDLMFEIVVRFATNPQ